MNAPDARTDAAMEAMRTIPDDQVAEFERDPMLWNARRALAAADAADAPLAEKLATAARNLIYGNGGGGKDNDRWEKLQTALAEFDAARGDSQGTAANG